MILLDTNAVLWLSIDPAKLSHTAKSAIENARKNGEGLAVSGITLVEVTSLVSKGRLHLTDTLESVLQAIESHFNVLPITSRACARMAALPAGFPKDPADRLIAGTALAEGMTLLTSDREIRRSKVVSTVW